MSAFAGVFDFSMQGVADGVTADDDRWCFIDNLSIKYKILADLLAPSFIFFMFLIYFIFSKFVCRKRLRIRHKKLNIEAASLAVFLFIVGKIVDTLFKMLACTYVGDKVYHWYFAYDECYGREWIISFTLLSLIVFGFAVPYVLAWKFTDEERYDKTHFIYQVSNRFKPQYWYWEYIIFLRRIVIAFFAVVTSTVQSKLLFMFVMVCFIVIQWGTDPFAAHQVESCLLVRCHVMVSMV